MTLWTVTIYLFLTAHVTITVVPYRFELDPLTTPSFEACVEAGKNMIGSLYAEAGLDGIEGYDEYAAAYDCTRTIRDT